MSQPRLYRFLWLSIAAAVATIALKTAAWLVTGSTGLLSDAVESVVNLVAAVVALAALHWASRPPDADHAYGHAKAEYFSAGVEGTLIFVAALSIAVAAIGRLRDPQPLDDVAIGLTASAAASVINLGVGVLLVREGRAQRSITLEADGRHLLSDVLTSVGVIAGVGAVALTGWELLDPLIALAVAANLVVTGVRLVRRSIAGLMDHALTAGEQRQIAAALAPYTADGVIFHAVRTRQGGRRAFASLHMLVPGAWSVQRSHDLAEEVEAAIRRRLPYVAVFTHVEPLEDPRSFDDRGLDPDATLEPSS
jgi:cation diffusion facilitator family transporter